MTSYILQVHSRYLDLPLVPPSTGIARHTGYDLVTLNDNGEPSFINSVDLTTRNGRIYMVFVEGSDGQPFIVNVSGEKQSGRKRFISERLLQIMRDQILRLLKKARKNMILKQRQF